MYRFKSIYNLDIIILETPASKSWTQGHKCPRGTISDGTLFSRQTGLTLEEAKTQCALGCDSRDDCMFADLYYTTSSATCYLKGSDCGDWETNTHPAYHLYRKGRLFYYKVESLRRH